MRWFMETKYLTRRIASDKILYDKPFNIAKNPKHKRFLLVERSDTLDKQNISAVKNENILNKELAEELRELIIRKF